MTWRDDGVALTVEVSDSGTWISPLITSPQPFLTGGANGQPLSWLLNIPAGVDATMATWSVNADGEFSNYSNSNNANLRAVFETYRDFTITPGHRYQIGIEVKGYNPRGNATRVDFSIGLMKVGQTSPVGNRYSNNAYSNGLPDNTNWYQLVLTAAGTLTDASPADRVRVILGLGCITAPTTAMWGAIWRSLVIVDLDQTTSTTPLTFKTVLCDTLTATTRYGRARFTERYDVGTFQLTLNNVRGDYRYHEDNTGFRPGRVVRVRATYGGITYPFCYGVIDRVKNTLELDGTAKVQLTVFDTTSFTSDSVTPNITPRAYGLIGGDPFLTGTRIGALLDFAGIPPTRRSLDAGQWPTQVVNQSGRAIREEIGITADSEGGAFYGERDGTIVYRDRTWSTRDPKGNSVQAQIMAVPGTIIVNPQPDDIPTDPNAVTVCPFSIETDWSLERVINTIRLATAGGNAYPFSDANSIKENGVRTYQRLDYVNARPDNTTGISIKDQLAQRAADIFSTSLTALIRVQSLGFRPNPDTWPFALSVFLNWLVRVYYIHPTEGWGFSTVVRVQSVTHSITPRGWVCTIDVDQPIDYNDALEPLPPSDNGWDIGTWDVALWDET